MYWCQREAETNNLTTKAKSICHFLVLSFFLKKLKLSALGCPAVPSDASTPMGTACGKSTSHACSTDVSTDTEQTGDSAQPQAEAGLWLVAEVKGDPAQPRIYLSARSLSAS